MAQRSVAVVCESTACLPRELVDRYAIAVIPVPFAFGTTTFRDGVDLTPEEFFARLETAAEVPKTSPPEPGAYLATWEAAARDDRDVLLVTVARNISTFQRSTQLAQAMVAERVPGACVRILDSGSAAMGQGFVALAAARAAARGLCLEAVCAEAEAVASRVSLIVALDTLRYLARTSRIPQIAAVVSSWLDLKPIIRLRRGEVQPLRRVRSRRRSLEQLVELVCASTPPGIPVHLAVQHARAPEEARRVLAQLAERLELAEACVTEFTPVMGAYCGPGLVAAAFYPQQRQETAC